MRTLTKPQPEKLWTLRRYVKLDAVARAAGIHERKLRRWVQSGSGANIGYTPRLTITETNALANVMRDLKSLLE
jgi:hypothetical protein